MRKHCITIALAILMSASGAWAETLYVRPSTTCANNGDGTAYACAASAGAAGAWNNADGVNFTNVQWGAGAGKVSAGDTLYIAGTFRAQMSVGVAGTDNSTRVVIRGDYPSDPGVVYGSDSVLGVAGDWTDQGGNVWRKNIGALTYLPGGSVWFNDQYGVANATPSALGQWSYTSPNLDIYSTGNPTTVYTSISVTSRYRAIYNTYDYVDIRNLSISQVQIGSGVSSSWLYAGGIDNNGGDYVRSFNNTITQCGIGIQYGSQATSGEIYGNTITSSWWESSTSTYGYAIRHINAIANAIHDNTIDGDITWYGGTVERRGGAGIGFYGGGTGMHPVGASAYNNTIRHTKRYGIVVFNNHTTCGIIALNLHIYGNDISDVMQETTTADTDGIAAGETSGVSDGNYYTGIWIYQNKIRNMVNSGVNFANHMGVGSGAWSNVISDIGTVGIAGLGWGGIRLANGAFAYNNTIVNSESGHGIVVTAASVSGASASSITNNLISGVVASTKYGIYVVTNGQGTGSNNLVYNVPSGQEVYQVTNTNGVYTDPLFVSSTDFHLQAASPAIDHGNATICAQYPTDYAGRNQLRYGRGCEIGAYAFPHAAMPGGM